MSNLLNDDASLHYLKEKMGEALYRQLSNDDVTEIALNPDGAIWLTSKTIDVHRASSMSRNDATAFVNALANYHDQFLNESKPYLDCTLPFNGERVSITIPPIVDGPSFTIRKHAQTQLSLNDLISQRVLSPVQATILNDGLTQRKNILVSGGPGSGKTTLTNALLSELTGIVPDGHRILLLEDVPELRCPLDNVKAMRATEHVSFRALLKIALRESAKRIMMNEVRDGSVLDMLKAWNTGTPGGIATIHANSPEAVLQRLVDLAHEATEHPPYALIGEVVDLIIQVSLDPTMPSGRRVTGIINVDKYDRTNGIFITKNIGEKSE